MSGFPELTQAWCPSTIGTRQSACSNPVLSSLHLSRKEYEISKLDL